MADITITAAQIAPVYPEKADIRSYIANATITKGQAVYILATGKVGLADANGGGRLPQFRGISLNGADAGGVVSVLHEGEIYGFAVSALDADVFVFLSNTAGALATLASVGGTTVRCGRVVTLTDNDATKVIKITTQWEADW